MSGIYIYVCEEDIFLILLFTVRVINDFFPKFVGASWFIHWPIILFTKWRHYLSNLFSHLTCGPLKFKSLDEIHNLYVIIYICYVYYTMYNYIYYFVCIYSSFNNNFSNRYNNTCNNIVTMLIILLCLITTPTKTLTLRDSLIPL